MRSPNRSDGTDEQSLPARHLPPEARQQVRRAAFLRPINLLVVAIGGVFFAVTFTWWSIPLTLVIYAVLVFLAARHPLFVDSVLQRSENRPRVRLEAPKARDVSPERRARWLPRGETRQKVEAALEVYRRTQLAIQESGDVVQATLDDAGPKLDGAAERLVDVAQTREKVASAIQDLKARPDATLREGPDSSHRTLSSALMSGALHKPCASCMSSPMAKYASCSRAHGLQKDRPQIFTTA